jgi:hypothetical protein
MLKSSIKVNIYPKPVFKTLQFCITYKWAQYARVFVPGKPFQSNAMQH